MGHAVEVCQEWSYAGFDKGMPSTTREEVIESWCSQMELGLQGTGECGFDVTIELRSGASVGIRGTQTCH